MCSQPPKLQAHRQVFGVYLYSQTLSLLAPLFVPAQSIMADPRLTPYSGPQPVAPFMGSSSSGAPQLCFFLTAHNFNARVRLVSH